MLAALRSVARFALIGRRAVVELSGEDVLPMAPGDTAATARRADVPATAGTGR